MCSYLGVSQHSIDASDCDIFIALVSKYLLLPRDPWPQLLRGRRGVNVSGGVLLGCCWGAAGVLLGLLGCCWGAAGVVCNLLFQRYR